jgi:ATP-dependent DNA helicase RecQ
VTSNLDLMVDALSTANPAGLKMVTQPPFPDGPDYAVWRLGIAWNDHFGLDEAVLVRQALRTIGDSLFCPAISRPLLKPLASAGVRFDNAGNLTCSAFRPDWLEAMDLIGRDGLDSAPINRVPDESVPSEAYVADSFGYGSWKSRALKEACWKVLQSPSDATVLVALPTGSGKSLCFHYLARFSTGLTIVIVPTVALAIDHYRSAMGLPALVDLVPQYFASDDPTFDPGQVTEQVRSGVCRLLFCSPESCVSGRLRDVLTSLAEEGRLDNVIIDEAHIVGTWGAYFRIDFQFLSTQWKSWRRISNGKVKTVLLSATFTQECREGLRRLFPAEHWDEFISQRLRPELTYFSKRFGNEDERVDAVMSAVRHLPRPAILYTTRVADTKIWFDRLFAEGFRRIEAFTGETPARERKQLLTLWRDNKIDLMVATSAFGLGVDKADVRSVIHACLPENLDRYYQEVGRAGRDGFSAMSLLTVTKSDERLAESMGPTLLRPSTIQDRWSSLWRTSEVIDLHSHKYRVNVRTKRDELIGTRTYEENVRWNKRLLLQLYRAGLIDLIDLRLDISGPELAEWATLLVKFPPGTPDVASLIELERSAEVSSLANGLEMMKVCVGNDRRLCAMLSKMYGKGTVRICGGCPGCRLDGRPKDESAPLPIPSSKVTIPAREIVLGLPPLGDAMRDFHPLARWVRRAAQLRRAVRFACADENLKGLIAIAKDAFGGQPDAYRIDGLGSFDPSWTLPFRIEADESLVVVHAGTAHQGALGIERGASITHWICEDCSAVDERGRAWIDYPGVRPYLSPESWINSGGALVY